MSSAWKTLLVLLLVSFLVSAAGDGDDRPTFRQRAMQMARRISRYQEQLAEFAKTVQNVNFVSNSTQQVLITQNLTMI